MYIGKTLLPFLCGLILFTLAVPFHSLMAQPQPSIQHFESAKGFTSSVPCFHIQTDRDKNIWIVQSSGVLKYNSKSYQKTLINLEKHGVFLRFHESPSGKKYVIDHTNRIFHIEGDSLRPFALNDSLVHRKFCSDFYFDEQERLHIAYPGFPTLP